MLSEAVDSQLQTSTTLEESQVLICLNIWCHLIILSFDPESSVVILYDLWSFFVAHSVSSVSSRAAAALARGLTSCIDDQLLRWCSNLERTVIRSNLCEHFHQMTTVPCVGDVSRPDQHSSYCTGFMIHVKIVGCSTAPANVSS